MYVFYHEFINFRSSELKIEPEHLKHNSDYIKVSPSMAGCVKSEPILGSK